MNSNNLYFSSNFGSNLVNAIKLSILIHDLAVFSRKRKKHRLKVFSKILAK